MTSYTKLDNVTVVGGDVPDFTNNIITKSLGWVHSTLTTIPTTPINIVTNPNTVLISSGATINSLIGTYTAVTLIYFQITQSTSAMLDIITNPTIKNTICEFYRSDTLAGCLPATLIGITTLDEYGYGSVEAEKDFALKSSAGIFVKISGYAYAADELLQMKKIRYLSTTVN